MDIINKTLIVVCALALVQSGMHGAQQVYSPADAYKMYVHHFQTYVKQEAEGEAIRARLKASKLEPQAYEFVCGVGCSKKFKTYGSLRGHCNRDRHLVPEVYLRRRRKQLKFHDHSVQQEKPVAERLYIGGSQKRAGASVQDLENAQTKRHKSLAIEPHAEQPAVPGSNSLLQATSVPLALQPIQWCAPLHEHFMRWALARAMGARPVNGGRVDTRPVQDGLLILARAAELDAQQDMQPDGKRDE